MTDTHHPSTLTEYKPETTRSRNPPESTQLQKQINQATEELDTKPNSSDSNTNPHSPPSAPQQSTSFSTINSAAQNPPLSSTNLNNNFLTTSSPNTSLSTDDLNHIKEEAVIKPPTPIDKTSYKSIIKITLIGISLFAAGIGIGLVITFLF